MQNIRIYKGVILYLKIPGENYSSAFDTWEAEDECFVQDLCNWCDITLQKVNWLGLPLSVFVNSPAVYMV